MLLTMDVGNTNITFGVFNGKELITTFRMTTKNPRTSDEFGVSIIDMIERNQIAQKDITHVITASVVPDVMHSLNSAVIKYFGITCYSRPWCKDRNPGCDGKPKADRGRSYCRCGRGI